MWSMLIVCITSVLGCAAGTEFDKPMSGLLVGFAIGLLITSI
jgi:hypothetical protein